MSEFTTRFPKGYRMLCQALERERIPLRLVRLDMVYTGVSWAIRVRCAEANYDRQDVLCPYHGLGDGLHHGDIWADTAFGETCERIAEELSEALAPKGLARARRETGSW